MASMPPFLYTGVLDIIEKTGSSDFFLLGNLLFK